MKFCKFSSLESMQKCQLKSSFLCYTMRCNALQVASPCVCSCLFLKKNDDVLLKLISIYKTIKNWPCILCHLFFFSNVHIRLCVYVHGCVFNTCNIFIFNLTTPLQVNFPFCYSHFEVMWVLRFGLSDCCRFNSFFLRSMYCWWSSIRTLIQQKRSKQERLMKKCVHNKQQYSLNFNRYILITGWLWWFVLIVLCRSS